MSAAGATPVLRSRRLHGADATAGALPCGDVDTAGQHATRRRACSPQEAQPGASMAHADVAHVHCRKHAMYTEAGASRHEHLSHTQLRTQHPHQVTPWQHEGKQYGLDTASDVPQISTARRRQPPVRATLAIGQACGACLRRARLRGSLWCFGQRGKTRRWPSSIRTSTTRQAFVGLAPFAEAAAPQSSAAAVLPLAQAGARRSAQYCAVAVRLHTMSRLVPCTAV